MIKYETDGILKYYFHSGTELACCGYDEKGHKPAKIVIPDHVNGYLVTLISGNAFSNEDSLVEVEFKQSIEHIAGHAFYNCPNLKTVHISKSGMSRLPLRIAKFAFHTCPNLTEIIGLKRKTYLELWSMFNCSKLHTLEVSICKTEESVFSNCPQLSTVMIGNGADLSENTFKDSVVKKLCFEGNVAHIDKVTRWLKTNMEIVCLPNSNLIDLVYDGYHVEKMNS